MKSNSTRSLLLAAATLTSATSSLQATPIYWDGTGTGWGAAANWSTASGATTPDPAAAPTAADDVYFNISGVVSNQVISMDSANREVQSLTFSSTGNVSIGNGGGNRDLTIGSGGMTMDSGAGVVIVGNSGAGSNVFVRLGASQTWTNNSASSLTSRNSTTGLATGTTPVTLTMSATNAGSINNSGALNDGAAGAVVSLIIDSSGSGVSSIGGGNYSGGTTILRGALSTSGGLGTAPALLGATSGSNDARLHISTTVANDLTVQAGNSGLMALTGGGTNNYTGGILLNNNLTVGSLSSSAATLNIGGIISGTGNLTAARLGAANPTVILTGPSTFTGKTRVDSATLVVSSLNSVSGGTSSSSLGAPITIANGTISMSAVSASTLRYVGSGETTDRVIDLAGTNIGATLEHAGTGLLKFTSDLTTSGNGNKTLTIRGATGTGEISGIIPNSTGTTGLTKNDAGTWKLSGSNTYTGTTSLTQGVLEVTTMANGGTASSIGAASSANGNLVFGGGTLRYVGAGDSTNRGFTVSGAAGATIDASGLGAIHFTGTTAPSLTTATIDRTITFTGTNTDNNSFAAGIGNAGTGLTSVVKDGSGTWLLSGTFSYTGATTINGGKLIMNGTTAAGSTVALNAATLAGIGTMNGVVTTAGSTSIISPGNSPGTLNLKGGLDATLGAKFLFELGTSSDLLNLGSGAIVGSTAVAALTFEFSDSGGLASGTPYNLINFGSASGLDYTDLFASMVPAGFMLDNSFGTGGFQINSSSLQVQFQAVPEPASLGILAASVALLSRRNRRTR